MILHLCFWNTKEFCKALVGNSNQVFNHSKWTKNQEDMGLELERGLVKKCETNYHSSSSLPVFPVLLLYLYQRTIVALQFAHPMTQKSLNLVKELEEYWKCLMMGGFTLLSTTKAPPKYI